MTVFDIRAAAIRRNTLWNLLGSALPMLIGIAAIPFIYSNLGINRTGVLTIVWALIGYFSIFDFGLGRAITQRIASAPQGQPTELNRTIATTGIFLTALIGMIGGVVAFAAFEIIGIDWIQSAPELEEELRNSLLFVCLAIPATTVTAGLRGILEGEQRFKTINQLRLILGVSNFLGPVASIEVLGPRLDYTVGLLVIFRYAILFAHYRSTKHMLGYEVSDVSFAESRQLFQFGGWITLSNIISPLMVTADRFLIASTLGVGVVAYYTIPAEFMIRLLILPAAITTALFPVFSQKISSKSFGEAQVLYTTSIKTIFLMMALITGLIFFGAESGIELWLGTEFAGNSSSVAMVLALGILFNSMAQVPHAYVQAAGNARFTALLHALELIIYLPALLLLMKTYGILGAAMAWVFRATVDFLLLHLKAMRITP